ncbi:MAG: GAF domain-containing sensor histidine kinase [Oscillatoriaceae bacterium SKW80]|nr:GAF domain-containing sensor histidine kinase [Oscillatoriaceae bacterium SKYG93]MCX8121605.1 GAF domain-containing sensor histidine kinase [Oscillatoriaceae bacterium SKW80]MDW8453913.1 GAF domain-containing sensor histidine kinase [Oscillatoriaceae cyanobacterium SKYGB_i_bin93]
MSCVDNVTATAKEEQRLQALAELELLDSQKVPVFEQATKIAAEFLETPICIVGFMDKQRQWLKAGVGLEKILPLNQPSSLPQLERQECFCSLVVENSQVVSIRDTATHPTFANSSLVQQYGIRAYLGVPLLNSEGYCLGTLAVMDLAPRSFGPKEVKFLEMTARWVMSEFERQRLSEKKVGSFNGELQAIAIRGSTGKKQLFKQIKSQILSRLTQELRTPLTSVIGMASVLSRGIYGALTNKQKEYLQIINDSGKYLLSLVDEILALGEIDEQSFELRLSAVDLEMICQQVINALQQEASRREQEIRLSIEPGQRIWNLDKVKVYQLLYHLIFSVIHAATVGSCIRLHVSHKNNKVNILVWVSHPWLSEGISVSDLCSCQDAIPFLLKNSEEMSPVNEFYQDANRQGVESSQGETAPKNIEDVLVGSEAEPLKAIKEEAKRSCLGLLLSCLLAEMHGGEIRLQGSPTGGYRYQVSLPASAPATE